MIAVRSEVSEWLRRSSADTHHDTDTPAGPGTGATPRQATPPAPPPALRRRQWLAGLALLVVAGAVLAWHYGRWPAAQPPGQPTSWSVTANALSVFDRSGGRLRTYTTDGPLDVAFYDAYGATPDSATRPVRFVDLEGDGSVETVFRQVRGNPYETSLVVLDAGGRRRFAHIPRSVRFGSEDYAGPWAHR